MSRKPIITGNWKMNKLQVEAKELFLGIKKFVKQYSKEELPTVIVAPTFLSIPAVESERCDCGCRELLFTAAQNCYFEKSGAYTGEVSAAMVASTGAKYVILGHSERRAYYGETVEILKDKVKLALANGLTPIFCIGEVLE